MSCCVDGRAWTWWLPRGEPGRRPPPVQGRARSPRPSSRRRDRRRAVEIGVTRRLHAGSVRLDEGPSAPGPKLGRWWTMRWTTMTDATQRAHGREQPAPRASSSPPAASGTSPPSSTCCGGWRPSGFDWVAGRRQHGPVDPAELHAVGRALADAGTAIRRAGAGRGPGLDRRRTRRRRRRRRRAVRDRHRGCRARGRASRYPPEGERSWGPFAPVWGGAAPDPAAANAAVRCLG